MSRPKYAIALNAIGPCWYCAKVEGDPGRTSLIEHATKYRTQRAAIRAMQWLADYYPNRSFVMDRITKTEQPKNWQSFLAQIHPDANGLSFECAPGLLRNEFMEWRSK